MARYLYGARNDDDRYLGAFEEQYGGVGKTLLSEVKNSSRNLALGNSLAKVMDKGISKAKKLASDQAKAFGRNPRQFCKDFNELLNHFEILSYRSLEYTSTDIAYRLVSEVKKQMKSQTELTNKVSTEKKVLKKLEESANGEVQNFWDSVSGLMKNSELRKLLPLLIEQREEDFIKRKGKYGAGYGGLLGESASYLLLKAVQAGEGAVLNLLQKDLRSKNIEIKMTGKQGFKTDLELGEMGFSIKNYTALRNRFLDFTEEGQNLSKESSVDMTIQSSGELETVINNFAKDTKTDVLNNKGDDLYTFLMSAIYYNQFGISDYYLDAMQILDVLSNIYAYVFLAQGTTKELGYTIEKMNSKKGVAPGYMWLVGKGIIPIYLILEAIKDNLEIVLNTQRNKPRSGIYAHVKIRGAKQAISSVDTMTRTRGPIYGEDQPSFYGRYYRKSFNTTPYNYHMADTIMQERYTKFSKQITTSIKLHLELKKLDSLITNLKI